MLRPFLSRLMPFGSRSLDAFRGLAHRRQQHSERNQQPCRQGLREGSCLGGHAHKQRPQRAYHHHQSSNRPQHRIAGYTHNLLLTACVMIRHNPPVHLFDVARGPRDAQGSAAVGCETGSNHVNDWRSRQWLANWNVRFRQSFDTPAKDYPNGYLPIRKGLSFRSIVRRRTVKRIDGNFRADARTSLHHVAGGQGQESSRLGSCCRAAEFSWTKTEGRNATLLFIPAS